MANLRLISMTGLIAALSFGALQGCGDDEDDDGSGGTGGTAGAGTGGSAGKGGTGGTAGTGTGGSAGKGGSGGSSGSGTGGSAGATGGSAGASAGGAGGSAGGAAGGSAGGGAVDAQCAEICNGAKGIVTLCDGIDLEGATEFETEGACVTACTKLTASVLACRYEHWGFLTTKATPSKQDKDTHCPHVYGGSTAPAACK
jgi:hypothetical protein